MPRKFPSELDALGTPDGADILVAQRLPEAKMRGMIMDDLIAAAVAAFPGVGDGTISTAKLAWAAVTNPSFGGTSGGLTLTNYMQTVLDQAITLTTPYAPTIVLGYLYGYGSRSSGTGDYGVEAQLSRVSGSVMSSGYPAFATGGASAAATIGGAIMLPGLYWAGASPGLTTFRLSAKYVPGNAGYVLGGYILALELKR